MSVVVGYLPNPYGRAALAAAASEARRRGVRLVVVNATKGESLVDPAYASDAEITELERELAGSGVEVDVRRVMGADVAEQIIGAAHETTAELIVIGIRHRSQVGKMLMGSVASRVLMEAPCWVLCVKPDTTD